MTIYISVPKIQGLTEPYEPLLSAHRVDSELARFPRIMNSRFPVEDKTQTFREREEENRCDRRNVGSCRNVRAAFH